MVRTLPSHEAPKTIVTAQGDKMIATSGYRICYNAGNVVHKSLDSYEQWAVDPVIFSKTYRVWDEPNWTANQAEAHLMALGCQAYYKSEGVWARKLESDVYMQTLENTSPALVTRGRILAIGVDGEPYSMPEPEFHKRYQASQQSLIRRLVAFFKPR
jgi:hypothetical protein